VCKYVLDPASRTVSDKETTQDVTVKTTSGCAWKGSESASWITITDDSGVGSGKLTYKVTRNTTGQQRKGTISIAGATHTVTQSSGKDRDD
jgi:hypothetical protein